MQRGMDDYCEVNDPWDGALATQASAQLARLYNLPDYVQAMQEDNSDDDEPDMKISVMCDFSRPRDPWVKAVMSERRG